MSPSPYAHLLAPGRIGSLECRNRIVMCPMGERLGNPDGTVSETQQAYYGRRAEGGAGLIMLGSVAISHPYAAYAQEQLGISHDGHIAGYARLARRVGELGARLGVQLVHNGTSSLNDMAEGRPVLVPSTPEPEPRDALLAMVTPDEGTAMMATASSPRFAVRYHEATEDDLAEVIASFGDAAQRCAEAGMHGIELHAGHGYLIDAFLSPVSNRRTDRWGGTGENRARLLTEVTRAIRARLGDGFPLWCRLNGFEAHRPGGTTVDDAIETARLGVVAGLDAVHVSASAPGGSAVGVTDSHTPHRPAAMLPWARAIKEAVDVPIITMGRLSPRRADDAIAAGDTDFVAMGRALLADADLPNKLIADRGASVRPCVHQYRCIGNISVGAGVRCIVNPSTGREDADVPGPSGVRRTVLVVGGGPAGMEISRLLALDGHDVTLWEATRRLGGQFAAAAALDDSLSPLLDWLLDQVHEAGIHVQTDRRATVENCTDGRFDRIIVAAGSNHDASTLHPRVRAADDVAWSLIGGTPSELGAHVVVLGGDRSGLAMARACLAAGSEVTVVEGSAVFASDMGLPGRFRLVHDARLAGIALIGSARLIAVSDDGVSIEVGGQRTEVAADTVVAMRHRTPLTDLADELLARQIDVSVLGECVGSHGVESIFDAAAELARSIRVSA